MNPLDDWLARVGDTLGLEHDFGADLDRDGVRDLVLDLARDVAHGVARPAAPLTTFLVGLAAGRDGGNPAAVRRAADEVRRLAELWAADRGPAP
jgi:Domain of unknown function (DUF6457)